MTTSFFAGSRDRVVAYLVAVGLTTFLTAVLPAWAQAPIAVLHSARNAQAYQEEHLGTFDDDWLNFKQALEAANIRYDEITDSDAAQGQAKLLSFKLIVVPLLIDLPPDALAGLTVFHKNGGKLLITDGGGTPEANAQALEQLAGATVVKQSTATDKRELRWAGRNRCRYQSSSPSVPFQRLCHQTAGASPLATWIDASGIAVGPAVVKKGNSIFLAWAPGMQGDISSNAALIGLALEELSPGITQQSCGAVD